MTIYQLTIFRLIFSVPYWLRILVSSNTVINSLKEISCLASTNAVSLYNILKTCWDTFDKCLVGFSFFLAKTKHYLPHSWMFGWTTGSKGVTHASLSGHLHSSHHHRHHLHLSEIETLCRLSAGVPTGLSFKLRLDCQVGGYNSGHVLLLNACDDCHHHGLVSMFLDLLASLVSTIVSRLWDSDS